jgi:FkbM family methyltransferase
MRILRDVFALWTAVVLMAVFRGSLGAGWVFRRHIRRAKAKVVSPFNRYHGATIEVEGRLVFLRGFRSSDYEVFYQIFAFREYQSLCTFLKSHEEAESQFVFVDCGANVGLASAFMRVQFPDWAFVGIEPSFDNISMASINMNYDKLLLRALASENGLRVNLVSPAEDPTEWAFRTEKNLGGEIETIDLANVLNELDFFQGKERVVLKVDVEGAEFEVFGNVPAEIVNRFYIMIVEIHDFSGDSKALVRHICSFGFFAFPMGEYWFFLKK